MLNKNIFLLVLYFFRFHSLNAADVSELTLSEKIGQLLMVHFHGEIANQEAKALIQDLHIGNIIYYNWANSLHSPEQVSHLSASLQALTGSNRCVIPLLIAIDQEGGFVSRLKHGFTIFPGNKALGVTQDLHLAEASAFAIGQELQAVGVNMNLAPVADINTNPKNPVIGIRSFGETAEVVISMAGKALQGFHRANMITCLKHFPGHGDVEQDSHYDLPILKKTWGELKSCELLPFEQLADQTDTIMTAHLMVPSIDPDNCMTLSKPCLDLLRDQIKFKGIILSDSLVMEGLLKNAVSVEEVALRAIEAGCDMLILGGKLLNEGYEDRELKLEDIRRIHQALMQAVETGRISRERIDQSVARILKLKEEYLTHQNAPEPLLTVKKEEHLQLANQIAQRALKIITDPQKERVTLFGKSKIAIIAPKLLQEDLKQTRITDFCTLQSFANLQTTQKEIEAALSLAKQSDYLIVYSYNGWRYAQQESLIRALMETGKPMVLVITRDSIDADLFSDVDMRLITHSPTLPSLQAVADFLMKGR